MTDVASRPTAGPSRGWSVLPVAMASLVILLTVLLVVMLIPSPFIVLACVVAVAILARITWRQRVRLDEQRIEREALAEQVRRSDERLDTLIRDTADVVTLVNPDGTIGYDSPALEASLGY